MARTLDQIIAELAPTYKPQVESLQKQQQLIPQQTQAAIGSADAAQSQAYENILGGARQRGLGFSGIPLAEQAKYASTVYAPAVLNAKTQGQQNALSLQDAILGVQERQRSTGQGIYQTEQAQAYDERQKALDRAFQSSEAAKNRAAANQQADLSKYFTPQTRYEQKAPGDFAFYGADNKPITAAQYAKSSGVKIGDVLRSMGEAGDQTAKQLYSQLANVAGNPTMYKQSLDYYKKQFPYILGGV